MDYQNHLPASSKYMCSKAFIEKSVLLAPRSGHWNSKERYKEKLKSVQKLTMLSIYFPANVTLWRKIEV